MKKVLLLDSPVFMNVLLCVCVIVIVIVCWFVCLFVCLCVSKAKEAELQLINRILDDSDLTARKFREWKQCNEELLLEIERLSAEKERARTAKEEAETAEVAAEAEQGSDHRGVGHATETQVDDVTVSEGQSGAFGLRLSLGEELVDAELPGSLDTTTTSETSVSVDPLNLSSTSVFSDNYFFIWGLQKRPDIHQEILQKSHIWGKTFPRI